MTSPTSSGKESTSSRLLFYTTTGKTSSNVLAGRCHSELKGDNWHLLKLCWLSHLFSCVLVQKGIPCCFLVCLLFFSS